MHIDRPQPQVQMMKLKFSEQQPERPPVRTLRMRSSDFNTPPSEQLLAVQSQAGHAIESLFSLDELLTNKAVAAALVEFLREPRSN